MQIRRVNTEDARDVRQFIDFPFHLYRSNPQWVPAMKSEMQLVMNRKRHPFYHHSEADFFLAENNGEIAGRIAVLHNRNYTAHHNLNTAFFYYFDALDDVVVSRALFAAAYDWAKQRGLNAILGPKGFLRSSGVGMLVEGFEFRPAMGILYNYPYYDALLTDSGFVKETDYLSGYLERSVELPLRLYEIAEKIRERGNFWIKTFKNKAEMRRWIPVVNLVHHESFHNNAGYYPTTDEEFAMIANTMIQIADPDLIKLIMKEDQVVGFVIAYADVSEALQKTRGELWPFGWYTLLKEQKRTQLVDLNGVGLLPEYQGRGANAFLYAELEKTLRARQQFRKAEIVQVDERNFKSKSDMETMGVIWHKRHRLYTRPLG